MRIPRIYTAQPLTSGQPVELEAQASHHLNKVLRKQVGDELLLFNGDGNDYSSRIDAVNKKFLLVKVGQATAVATESPLRIHLGICISKGDRMDLVMQKASELGAAQITPLFSSRTEVRLKGERLEKKQLHWHQIIISACEQSGRSVIPTLQPAVAIDNWTAQVQADKKLVLHHRASTGLSADDNIKSSALLIGPEGGLSEDEIMLAEQRGFECLALGPRVMRTETAPLAALSVLQFIWGDF
jgi:16S rRNA (uracil1498-N3)-methyltransferase